MEPLELIPIADGPLKRLIIAINHYISTGNHFGEGFALGEGSRVRIVIPVNLYMERDQKDFEAFRSRFDELADEFNSELEDMGRGGLMRVWTFLVDYKRVDELARAFRERPGSLGWGSRKESR